MGRGMPLSVKDELYVTEPKAQDLLPLVRLTMMRRVVKTFPNSLESMGFGIA